MPIQTEHQMITKQTIFILGAGASNPYKYPLGIELVKIICGNLENAPSKESEKSNFEILQGFGYSADVLLNFKKELIYSDTPSIDSFLEHRSEYLELGKLAIAQALIPFEITDNLFSAKRSWYKYIFGKLSTSFNDFDKNKISFLTFNYDRSLEHYLMTALHHKYGKTEKECADKLQKIPIVHLYGQLSSLPWQNHSGNNVREYDTTITPETLKKSSAQIKIIYEDVDKMNDPEFKKAFQLLRTASRIYFLGFGYHETNLRRLRLISSLSDRLSEPKIFGTSYHLTYEQRNKIPTTFKIKFYPDSMDMDILDFLTEKIILE